MARPSTFYSAFYSATGNFSIQAGLVPAGEVRAAADIDHAWITFYWINF